MYNRKTQLAAYAVVPVLLGLAGAAIGAETTSAQLRCEIQTRSINGMIVLQGVAHANAPLTGSYQLRVRGTGSSGSSDVTQGGTFTAGPDSPVNLGQVMLGGGGSYEASLELDAAGATASCSERGGGI